MGINTVMRIFLKTSMVAVWALRPLRQGWWLNLTDSYKHKGFKDDQASWTLVFFWLFIPRKQRKRENQDATKRETHSNRVQLGFGPKKCSNLRETTLVVGLLAGLFFVRKHCVLPSTFCVGFDAPGIRVGLIGPRFRSQFAENHWSPSNLSFRN
jgi:hypothetical protein